MIARMQMRVMTALAGFLEPAIIDAISKMDVGCGFTALALNHLGQATTCVAAPAK